MLCIAHRGASGHAPENTLAAIRLALEMGAPWVEIDVHVCDGRLAVIHDPTLERTTSGAGRVADVTWEYLRSLDAGGGERVPSLDEVLDTVAGRAGVNIELKGADTAAPTAAVLRRRIADGWPIDQLLVSSFDHERLAELKRLLPAVHIGPLIKGAPLRDAAFAPALGAYSVNVGRGQVTPELIVDAHARGLKVLVYTVNETQEIERMRDLGVDGIITDYPDRAL